MSGWIKLYRKIMENKIWVEKPYDKLHAWIDMLLMACYENKEVLFGNQLFEVKRGDFIITIRQLCDRWGWSNTKVNAFLKLLEDEKMIIKKNDAKKTLISIVNYSLYQSADEEKTTKKHQKNDAKTTDLRNKEYKEVYIDDLSKDDLYRDTKDDLENLYIYNNTSRKQEVTTGEREILKNLRSVKNYPFDFEKDLKFIRTLCVDYPHLDILAESKKWVIYKLDKPLKANSNPRSQFRNWCEIASRNVKKNIPEPATPKDEPIDLVEAYLEYERKRFTGISRSGAGSPG